jgi:hypothetical protein
MNATSTARHPLDPHSAAPLTSLESVRTFTPRKIATRLTPAESPVTNPSSRNPFAITSLQIAGGGWVPKFSKNLSHRQSAKRGDIRAPLNLVGRASGGARRRWAILWPVGGVLSLAGGGVG